MNKNYIYMDGKAIINDEMGNQTSIEYYDNLDQVLVKENIIETMEKRIKELENESKNYSKKKRRFFIPYTLLCGIILLLIAPPITIGLVTGTNPYLYYVDTILGSTNYVLLTTLVMAISISPAIAFTTIWEYAHHKEDLRKENGINSELEFLKRQIEEERKSLASLQQEKTKNEEKKDYQIIEVNDLQQLRMLKNYLMFYYDLGYNSKKYYKYYRQGQLDDILDERYDDINICLAKKYFEGKGPVLSKKK